MKYSTIDTHCHLDFEAYEVEREQIILNAQDQNMGIINVGIDYSSSLSSVKLAKTYPNIWAAIGQHPSELGKNFDYKEFINLAKNNEKVVAIGEIGLDYFRLAKEEQEAIMHRQKDLFLAQLQLAHELNLPMIIHCRETAQDQSQAHDDMLSMLINQLTTVSSSSMQARKEFGVLHCFSGNWQLAQSYLDLGFLISFTGIITFCTDYDLVVKQTPLEKIMIETDSPFLSPEPLRGLKNKPQHIVYIAQKIAKIKEISTDLVLEATTKNAYRLFNLNKI